MNLTEAVNLAADAGHAAIGAYGIVPQIAMVQEECSELLLALARYQRGRATHRDIVEEAADVIIVAIQAAMIHGTEQELADFLELKSARLMARINGGTTPCDEK